jgi:signal transduction histidine kinase
LIPSPRFFNCRAAALEVDALLGALQASASMSGGLRYVASVAVLFAVYYGAARFGLHFDAVSGVATAVWPPTGIALAALLLRGRRLWPGVLLGAFMANLSTGVPARSALLIAVGNTGEALLGALLLQRVAGFRAGLLRLRDVTGLVALAALVATTVSASFGVLALHLGGVPANDRFVWLVWWLGDVTGALVVAPLLLTWFAPESPRLPLARLPELLALGVTLATLNAAIFLYAHPSSAPRSVLSLTYALFPPLIWAALRFGPRIAATATFATAALSVWGTATGHGPFAVGSRVESLVAIQAFMVVLAATALTLAAAVEERRRAVQLRDEFISIASHELNTPLTTLKLQLELLLRRAPLPDGAPAPARTAELLHRQVDRLTQLVGQLLDVSRIGAGRLELESQDVDLVELVRDVAAHFSAPGVPEIRLSLPGSAVVGRWDRMRIEQVVTNLISNAIKYGGGKPLSVELGAADGRARLAVRDEGEGIARADHERIFGRFERATAPGGIPGLGLGLYIARENVAAHGGTIRVESEPGQGATFIVELPLAPRVRRR